MKLTPLELIKRKLLKKILYLLQKNGIIYFHLDEGLAQQPHYASIIASGWQTLMIAHTLILDFGKISKCSKGAPGLDKVNWSQPVRPNDTIHCAVTVGHLADQSRNPLV